MRGLAGCVSSARIHLAELVCLQRWIEGSCPGTKTRLKTLVERQVGGERRGGGERERESGHKVILPTGQTKRLREEIGREKLIRKERQTHTGRQTDR